MANLMTSFYTGVTGLHAAQTNLNTTSHNIANAETVGYTRQQVIQRDRVYTNLGAQPNGILQAGLGTDIGVVRQVRDMFLDAEFRIENSRKAFYQVQYDTCCEVEDLFGEMEGVEFRLDIDEFWSVTQELRNRPDSVVNRELFISTASSFLESAIKLHRQLNNYQINLNRQITEQVDRINEISEEIYDLNFKISLNESGGEEANDFRDARNQLMDELSTLTYYTYEEDAKGIVSINIGNAPLVSSSLCFHMGTEYVINEDTGQPTEMLKAVWLDNGCGDVYDLTRETSRASKTDTGSLLGIFKARGDYVADYTDIPREPKQSDYVDAAGDFDEDAYAIAMRQYGKEVVKYNATTGDSVITRVQAEFDTLIHGLVTMINDVLCPNVTVDFAGGITGTDASGKAVNLAAGSYKILDTVNCPVCADDDETMGEELFQRRGTERYTVVTLNAPMTIPVFDTEGKQKLDEDGNPVTQQVTELYVYNEEDLDDIYTLYSIDQLQMNQKMLNNYSYLPVEMNPSSGMPGAYAYGEDTVFGRFLNEWKSPFSSLDPNNSTIYTMQDYYSAMVGDLANEGFVFKDILANQEGLTNSVEEKRQNISGVATSEEMVAMLKFQHSYSAASRYITVVDEMLQHLLERLG